MHRRPSVGIPGLQAGEDVKTGNYGEKSVSPGEV